MRVGSSFLDTISFFLLLIGNLFFSLVILKRWKGRILNILLPIIYPIACTISVIFTAQKIAVANEPTSYVVLFIVGLILLILLLKIRLEEAIFLSVFQTFHIIFSKSLSAGALSLFYQKNMYQLFQVDQYTQLITCIAFGIFAALFCLYYLTFKGEKMSAFFLAKGQVYYVMIVHIMLTLYLLFNCYNFYFNLDLIWFSVEQVYTCLALYAIFFLVLRFGFRISNLLQNQMRQKRQDLSILEQVSNYNQVEDCNNFLNLYSETSSEIKELINSGNQIGALEKIKTLDNKCKSVSGDNKADVSTSKIIQSLFYEFSNVCKYKNVSIDGSYYFDDKIKLDEKDLHEILSILLLNALEATLKLPSDNDKKITIETEKTDKEFILKISNPYNKKPKVDNGYLESSKKYTEVEGLGIGYVEQVLAKNKGKFKFKIDNKAKVFTATVTLKLNK